MDRRSFLQASINAASGLAAAAPLAVFPCVGFGQDSLLVATPIAVGARAAVATVHPLATDAAVRMLHSGGNAADAAIAAAVMLAVVDGHNSGLGGGCFVLARDAAGKTLAIDGRETAPAAAHAKMFYRAGQPQSELSQTGALASGVPGAVAAYQALSQRVGTGRWRQAMEMAAEVAESGFAISASYASRLGGIAEAMAKFPAARKIFLDEQGRAKSVGDQVVQSDIAATLRELATGGAAAFYQGAFAEKLDRWMKANGGMITAADMDAYRCVFREPVRTEFRGKSVVGFPPPSSGGIHVCQILGLLERFDLKQLYHNEPSTYFHVVAEAMRLAFADRAQWLGDPAFAEVPVGLLDHDYLSRRSMLIQQETRMPNVVAGTPSMKNGYFSTPPHSAARHTTHLAVVDSAGNWVTITATVNTSFGSKVVIPETGVVMNNQMDDFSIAPGMPNAFGLVGNEANAPAPGKRPLSSMSPTMIIDEHGPQVCCGAAGGPRIISATAQVLLGHVAIQLSLPEAMRMCRVHHQWQPDKLVLERTIDSDITSDLQRLGHSIEQVSAIGTAQAIGKSDASGLIAVAEPRLPGAAAAF